MGNGEVVTGRIPYYEASDEDDDSADVLDSQRIASLQPLTDKRVGCTHPECFSCVSTRSNDA